MGLMQESRESMIRNLNLWDSQTFAEAMANIPINEYNAEAAALLQTVLTNQRLNNKKMNGFCTEGLQQTEREGLGICYVDIFNQMEDTNEYWDPAKLLMAFCEFAIENKTKITAKAKAEKSTFEQLVIGMSGRLLRALPSYIREIQLKNSLVAAFKTATFEKDADLDKKYHCDIKMSLNDRTYYVWSFLSTQRAVVNFAAKFNSSRGPVPNGYHLLCPFDRKGPRATMYKGWCFYSKEHTDDVLAAVYQTQPTEYQKALDDRLIYSLNFFKKPVVIEKTA